MSTYPVAGRPDIPDSIPYYFEREDNNVHQTNGHESLLGSHLEAMECTSQVTWKTGKSEKHISGYFWLPRKGFLSGVQDV